MKRKELRRKYIQQFPSYKEHQVVYSFTDDVFPGIEYFVAIHDAGSFPSLGGQRTEFAQCSREEVINTVLALAYGMSLKAAYADVPFGGAKAFLRYEDKVFFEGNRQKIFEWCGECIQSLGGIYITAEDMGTGIPELRYIKKQTHYVRGLLLVDTFDAIAGDPVSAMTAYGVYKALYAALPKDFSMFFARCAIQGCLGKVGLSLTKLLMRESYRCIVSDIKGRRAIEDAFRGVPYNERLDIVSETGNTFRLFRKKFDILIPCAGGGVINCENILKRMKITENQSSHKLIVGPANNQLGEFGIEWLLRNCNVTYVPDFVANAGGLIACAYEEKGIDYVRFQVGKIFGRVRELLEETCAQEKAQSQQFSPLHIAERRAEEALQKRVKIGGTSSEN